MEAVDLSNADISSVSFVHFECGRHFFSGSSLHMAYYRTPWYRTPWYWWCVIMLHGFRRHLRWSQLMQNMWRRHWWVCSLGWVCRRKFWRTRELTVHRDYWRNSTNCWESRPSGQALTTHRRMDWWRGLMGRWRQCCRSMWRRRERIGTVSYHMCSLHTEKYHRLELDSHHSSCCTDEQFGGRWTYWRRLGRQRKARRV